MSLKNLLPGVGKMEILRKLLEIIYEFLEQRKTSKVEKQEVEKVQIEQNEKVEKSIKERKKQTVKKPKKDDFFNDENW